MRRRAALTLAMIVMAGLCLAAAEPSGPAALTEEDIVRMFVQGVKTDELIRLIEDSDGSYDLSDEMIEELKIAGIPETVVNAMIRRQAELNPVADHPTTLPAAGAPRLVVDLNPEWTPKKDKPLPTLVSLDALDPKVAEALDLRVSTTPITDLGIALFCRTADHIPDYWRSKTPLGRDFKVPRHRMLEYVAGADIEPASKFRNLLSKMATAPGARDSETQLNILTLEVPDELIVNLEPGVGHDLTLGLVVQIGDRIYLTVADNRDGVMLGETGDTTIQARVRGEKKNPLMSKVEFLKTIAAN